MNSNQEPLILSDEIPLLRIEIAQEEVIAVIKEQHPDWIQDDGECPLGVIYEYALAEPALPPEKAKGEAAA